LSILQGNSCSIDQKSDEIWTVQTDLQQIYPKSDRLLIQYSIQKPEDLSSPSDSIRACCVTELEPGACSGSY
jgi:hypothetical protein